MMNINILNNLIKGITDQSPLVHSYYTVSPYDSWNVKECKYGSVSFVVTRVNTRQSTTTYDATIYYADRLLENNANRDSVYSDAATVIQTIVGALNQADEYLEVSYPVGITLFEQDFADRLAGGYANLSISAKGMGECFEDDFTVPEIIATSAYFTKEEIKEYFPLRSDLSPVAFSGSFSDLKDAPNIVTYQEYESVLEALKQSSGSLAAENAQKVSVGYFDAWADGIEAELSERVTKQDYNQLVEATESVTGNLAYEVEKKFETLYDAVKDVTGNLAAELDNKVDDAYFDEWKKSVDTGLTNRPTNAQFDTLRTDIIDQLDTVRNDLDNKVGSAYFENWKDGIEAIIEDAPTGQEFNAVLNAIDNLSDEINDLPTRQDYNQVVNRVDEIETDLETRPTRQQFDNLIEATESVTGNLAAQINDKLTASVFEEWKKSTDIENRVTQQQYNSLFEAVRQSTSELAGQITQCISKAYFDAWADEVETQLNNTITKEEYNNLLEATESVTGNLAAQINDKISSSIFYEFKTLVENALDSKTNKQDFDNLYEAVKDVTTNIAVQLENKLDDNYFNEWKNGIELELSERVTKQDYNQLAENINYTKEVLEEKLLIYEARINLYLQSPEFETALMDIVTPIVIEYATTALDYYTRAEMDALLSNLNLEGYYTKDEIDAKLENLNLTEYYTKTEIDEKFSAIDSILNNVLYEY